MQPPPTAPKQPIKKLPAAIHVPANATVEDVKKLIAKEAGFSDYNRIGLFYPSTRKTLKDRKALIAEDKEVAEAGEVLVKDLGTPTLMMTSWHYHHPHTDQNDRL